jgi:hypothetical protein
MKKIIIALFALVSPVLVMAQNPQYENAMKGFLMKMSSAKSPEAYQAVANAFERMANTETKEWLPRYYAAFNYIMQAYTTSEKDKVDAILDQADKHLEQAGTLTQSEEVLCLSAWCKSARINVDPMSRGAKYGREAALLLEQAKKVNPNNPRIYFLQGQSAFYTPEAFGGGKNKAKELFQKAIELYGTFQVQNEFMPNWGAEQAKDMLAKCGQ